MPCLEQLTLFIQKSNPTMTGLGLAGYRNWAVLFSIILCLWSVVKTTDQIIPHLDICDNCDKILCCESHAELHIPSMVLIQVIVLSVIGDQI